MDDQSAKQSNTDFTQFGNFQSQSEANGILEGDISSKHEVNSSACDSEIQSCDSTVATKNDSVYIVSKSCDSAFESGHTLESMSEEVKEKQSHVVADLHINDIPHDSSNNRFSDEEVYNSTDSETKDTFQQVPETKSNSCADKVDELVLFEIDPEFFCKICGESYQDPRILPCLHNFCSRCIGKLNIHSRKEGNSYIICPVCKENTAVTLEEDCCFKENPFIANRIQLGQVTKGEAECVICKVRGDDNPAAGLCIECQDMLCKDCWEKHTYSRVTINHQIVSCDELSTGNYDKDLKNCRETFCPIHKQEMIKFYCNECSTAVCRDCILLHHQNHLCLTSEEAADKAKAELKTLLTGIKDKQDDLMNNDVQGLDEKIKSLHSLEQDELKKITNVIDDIIRLLEKEKTSFRKKVKQEFDSARNRCYMRKSMSEKNFCKMEEVAEITKKLLVDGKPAEIMCLADVVRCRAVSVLNTVISPEPVSWFKPPSVEAIKSPQKLDQVTFPVFKLIPAEKIYDPVKNIRCDATYKEWLKLKGIKTENQPPLGGNSSDASSANVVAESDATADAPSSDSKGAKPKRKRNKAPKQASTEQQNKTRSLITMNPENLSYSYGVPALMSQYPKFTNPGTSSLMSTSSNFANLSLMSARSNIANSSFMANRFNLSQPVIATLQYQFQLDTRLEGETKSPNLTGLAVKYSSHIMVSDSNNDKVKIFTKKGILKDTIDTVRPTGVAVLGSCIGWCTEASILIQSSDKSYTCKLNFQNASGIIPHPLSWYPSGEVIVGNGNNVRRYKIDKEDKNLKKIDAFIPKDIHGNPLTNIFNIRSHKDGRIVLVDWDLKAVVILDPKGNCTGQYSGSQNQGNWLPGGVCFDNVRGNVFATDYNGNRLLLLHGTTGDLLQEWSTSPQITRPWSIACDGGGLLFVTGNDPFIHAYKYLYP